MAAPGASRGVHEAKVCTGSRFAPGKSFTFALAVFLAQRVTHDWFVSLPFENAAEQHEPVVCTPVCTKQHPQIQHSDCHPTSHSHRVYMSFVHSNGWHCRFHEGDIAKIPISRRFIFHDEQKICEAARRGHGISDEVTHEALKQAIATGRGGVWLMLTDER
jgi:hypothetical protein